MKITATKREDIIKRRDEYDAKRKVLEDKGRAEDKAYNDASRDAAAVVEKKVSELIGNTTITIDIRVQENWHSIAGGAQGWEVTINANDRDHFAKNKALSWRWSVAYDKQGNLIKDSGSWSGLQAVTDEQLADLEESVRILKLLNSADWSTILNLPSPKWDDYHDKEAASEKYKLDRERPDFESELVSAQLEEILDGNTVVKLDQDQNYRGPVWILPTRVSDKFVTGYIVPNYFIEQDGVTAEKVKDWTRERRTAKSNLVTKNGDLIVRTLAE